MSAFITHSPPRSVLVTGAFGNVGMSTVRQLLAAGHRVVALDLQTPATTSRAAAFAGTLEVLWGNICDPTLWPRALQGIDTVVHLAAIIPPVTERTPELALAVNQTATLELVKHMEASTTAKRLIFASSMVVAGHEQHLRTPPLTVDEEPCPHDLYSTTKVECERYIRASSLQWSILRLAVCPPTHVAFADIDRFDAMFDASADGRVEVVHNDDVGSAFANAVGCEQAIGRVLYIGGGKSCQSYALDFYNRTFDAIGLNPMKAETLRPGPANFYGDWLDTTASQQLLDFQRHSLDDIISEIRANFGSKRWLLKIFAPLVNWLIERRSPHRSKRSAHGREEDSTSC